MPLHQLILFSGAFFPPVAFGCLALPPACCVPDQGHCDVEEAEAELCCSHNVALPELRENSVSVCALPAQYAPGMSELPAPSAWERAKRAKLREIEAHRRAIGVHEETAALFDSLGLEARAAAVRQRAERARAMLETALKEAEVSYIHIN